METEELPDFPPYQLLILIRQSNASSKNLQILTLPGFDQPCASRVTAFTVQQTQMENWLAASDEHFDIWEREVQCPEAKGQVQLEGGKAHSLPSFSPLRASPGMAAVTTRCNRAAAAFWFPQKSTVP